MERSLADTTLDGGLRLALTVPLLALIAADIPRILLLAQTLELSQLVGILVTIGGFVVLAILMATGTQTTGRLWGVILILVAGQAWVFVDVAVYNGPVVTWWPSGGAIVALGALAVWTPPRRRVAVVVPAMALLGALRIGTVTVSAVPLTDLISEGVAMLAMVQTFSIISDVLRVSVSAVESTLAERRGARTSRIKASDYRDQLREVERFLHDEVVHALRAIAMTRARVSATDAANAAADAWTKLKPQRARPSSSHDLTTALEQLAEDSPLNVDLRGVAPALPADVVEAVALAAGEALRNTQLHSGVMRAEMVASRQGRGVAVSIVDHGRGFDSTITKMRGSQSSIVERMESVGGSARISSGPSGTRVDIVWEPRIPDTHPAAAVSSRMAFAAVPTLVGCIVAAALLAPAIADPVLGIGATVLAVCVGAAGVWRLRRGPLTTPYRLSMAVFGPIAIIANIYALSPMDSDVHHLWMLGGVTPMVILMTFSSRFGTALAFALELLATGVLASLLHFGGMSTASYFNIVLTVPSVWLGLVGLQVFVDRLSVRALQAWESATRSDSHAHHLSARAEVSERRLARIREEIGPFLRAVGNGELDPSDPDVRRDAAVLESLVRDDIRFGGGSPAFRRQLTALRRGGWEVDVRMSSVGVRSGGEALQDLVEAVPVDTPGASMVITSANDQVVAILDGLPPEVIQELTERWEAKGGDALASEDFVRLSFALGPPPAPRRAIVQED